MPTGEKNKIAARKIKNVTYLGAAVNLSLSILKTIIGFISGSAALITDGVHSLSDLITDFAVLLGSHFGAKQPDHDHPYGHGRMETFSSLFIAIVLILIAAAMIYKSSMAIAQTTSAAENIQNISILAIIAAVVSIIAKEIVYRITTKTAQQTRSSALYANAWHHRSDAASSVAVLIGLSVQKFGYPHGDKIAAVVVAIMIILAASRIIAQCLHEFAEKSVDDKIIAQIKKIIIQKKSIQHWHRLRTRSVGREIFMDLHILVKPELTIAQAHQIAEDLENTIHSQIPNPVNITVHIEPDFPHLRK
jgi:cation diffusion facilitator family transporter